MDMETTWSRLVPVESVGVTSAGSTAIFLIYVDLAMSTALMELSMM